MARLSRGPRRRETAFRGESRLEGGGLGTGEPGTETKIYTPRKKGGWGRRARRRVARANSGGEWLERRVFGSGADAGERKIDGRVVTLTWKKKKKKRNGRSAKLIQTVVGRGKPEKSVRLTALNARNERSKPAVHVRSGTCNARCFRACITRARARTRVSRSRSVRAKMFSGVTTCGRMRGRGIHYEACCVCGKRKD